MDCYLKKEHNRLSQRFALRSARDARVQFTSVQFHSAICKAIHFPQQAIISLALRMPAPTKRQK